MTEKIELRVSNPPKNKAFLKTDCRGHLLPGDQHQIQRGGGQVDIYIYN